MDARNYVPALMYGANIGVSVDLTDIVDQNGNEVIEIDGTTSAVNFLRVTNSATGSAVTLSAQGDDTNVGLTINSLLTGALTLDSTSTGAVNLGTGSNAKTVTVGNTTGASALALKAGTGGIVATCADDNALTVGANGATNPVLKVNASTASVATGLSVTGAAAAGGLAVAVISSGTDEALTLDAKGAGTITLGGTSTGAITLGRATGVTGALTVTSAGASALAVGANGSTNPVLKVNASTASVATGISVTGAAAAGGVALAAISSGTDESLAIDAKGAGVLTLGGTSTGGVKLGTSTNDQVAVKGIYMNASSVAVAVPAITDPDIAKVDVSVASAFTFQPAVGDAVIAIPQEAMEANARILGCYVTATDQITIVFGSEGGNVTGGNKNFKFLVHDLT